jgi:diguanylate cyclase (GGDEF)-like protein/PAS domain S-box-containing protein
LLGYSGRSFLNSKVKLRDLTHPEDLTAFDSLFAHSLRPRSGSINFRVRDARGHICCIKGNFTKRRGTAAREILVALALEDARRVHEPGDDVLMESFKTLIEQTDDCIYIKNRNHVFLAASRNMPKNSQSARDRSEFVGKTDYDLLPEALADVLYRLESRAFAESRRANEIVQMTAQDGTKHWIDDRKYPINGSDGEIIGIFGIAPEITDYIEAQARLSESEESLREAQKIAGIGSFVLDIPAKAWKVSPEMDALLGIGAGYDRTLEGLFPLVHPDDHAAIADRLKSYFRGEREQFDSEYRIVRQTDGAVRWFQTRGRLERDALGKPLMLRGTAQDITERKAAEAALRESSNLLQLFVEHAPVALAMLDREMRYLAVNRRWQEIHDFNGLELIGRSHYEVFPNLPESWKALHRGVLAGEVVPPGEISLPRPDGSLQWLRREIRPWFAGDGQVEGIVIFSEDITERKRAETELRESKELLQLFIEKAPVALAMFDREMRYVAVSRRWLKEYGLVDREIIGRSHYEVIPDIPERWKEAHRRGLAGESQRADEDRFDRADGTVQWIRWEVIPWRAGDGSVGGIVLFAEDITTRKEAEETLRESKELLRLFIENAPAPLAMFDREMRYLAASRCWLEGIGFEEREVLGRSHYDLQPDLSEKWREVHSRALAGETVHIENDILPTADGGKRVFRRETRPWFKGDGSIGGIVVLAEDVTRQKESEDRLRLAATVFTGAREGITITDRSGTILEVNEAFTRITGYTRNEVLGRTPRLLQSGLQSKEFYQNMWKSLLRGGHWSGEIWNRKKSGDIYAETLTINAIRDANGEVEQYVGLFSDITEIKEHEQQLEHVAHFDALTGLPNRSLLADRLRQAMAHAHRSKRLLAVACFDVDGFKAVNDRYGHMTGDVLLTALAFRMKRALREGDTLARLGGDEFAAVILDLDDAKACTSTLNRLLAAAAEEAQIGEVMLRVSASAGVAFYPQTEDVDADMLLRQAGQAMYQAKLEGRNGFRVFDPSQDLMVRGRHENIEHIRQALAAAQFVLYYQPKVNLRTGKVVGAEALIRWQHPERGLLPPGMFLPVIEDHPLAIELGQWVIESALTQMESWQAEGFDLPVSVNVSATELQGPDFADRLRARLAAHPQVKPSSLELEVVETSAMQDVVRASQVLTACREIGVSIALDDFGTGYSSLTYLKRLPANLLKIDQSFVRDMLEEPENLTIIEGVLGLAAAFHRQVIAEGVETAEHGLMLLQMGCDLAQGYGIAASMPARDLRAWAAAWRPDPSWADVPVVRAENSPVLYAGVEHRAWLGAFEACLQGKRAIPPPLDAGQCRVGVWLDDNKRSARGMLPAVQAIETLHRQLHELAADIFKSQAEGPNPEGLARLHHLRYLQDKCLKRLRTFARTGSGKTGGMVHEAAL